MAIKSIEPEQFDKAPAVIVDSDATTNVEAIREIDTWASNHGFARTTEYWLRVVVVENQRRFRGTCYRLTAEDARGADVRLQEIEERRQRLVRPKSA